MVNQADEEDLANLIYEFGEERRSRRIARAIVRARPLSTTAELARVISAVAPPIKGEKIHPATRTFQAIRIRVNDELGEIQTLLRSVTGSAGSLLKPGGRVVMISFHSLEDRLVKDSFRESARLGELEILTKKPVTAVEQEALRNPRSRSAKLRAAERIEKSAIRKTKSFRDRAGVVLPCFQAKDNQCTKKSLPPYSNPGPGCTRETSRGKG